MRTKLLFAVALALNGCGMMIPAHSQLASPYSNSVFPSKIFTASGQTSTTIQLNGLVVPSTVGSSFASGTITLTGSSLTTVTFGVQGSSDNGGTFYALPIYVGASPTTTPTTTITATANGLYQVNLAGLTHIKFVTSGTFTATNVTLTLTASPNASVARGPGGTGGAVSSVFGRTGGVLASIGDYTFSQIAGVADPSQLPKATGSAFGVIKPDGTSCTVTAGVLTCSLGSGGVSSINGTPGAFTFTGAVSCVGTSCSFGSIFSTTYILISELGCASQNTNLTTGGGTDDTTCINNALALATASHPVVLIQDGASLIHGISGPAAGNWGIIGLGGGVSDSGVVSGTGFYLANSSGGDAITNGVTPISGVCGDPATTPPTRGVNLLFKDFVLNNNGPNNSQYCYGIDVQNMNGVEVSNVTFYLSSHYSLRLDNVGIANVHASKFEPLTPSGVPAPGDHSDGVHIDGPANDISISDSYFHTGDDAIALNAPEGYCGPIKRVTVTNSTFDNSWSAMRIYSGSNICANGLSPVVDTVNISNYSGTAKNVVLTVGVEGTTAPTIPNAVTNVTWGNSNVSGAYNAVLMDNVGTMALHYDWTPTPGPTSFTGFVAVGGRNVTVNTLDLSGSSIVGGGSGMGMRGMVDTEDSYYYGGGVGSAAFTKIITQNNLVKNFHGTTIPNVLYIGAHGSVTDFIESEMDQSFVADWAATAPTNWFSERNGPIYAYLLSTPTASIGTATITTANVAALHSTGPTDMIATVNGEYGLEIKNLANTGGSDTFIHVCGATIGFCSEFYAFDSNFGALNAMVQPRSGYFATQSALTNGFFLNTETAAPITIGTNNVKAIIVSGTTHVATFTVGAQLPVYTVSGLPSASTLGAGTQVIVSDAASFTPGACSGGGSAYMIAVSDGGSWSCH